MPHIPRSMAPSGLQVDLHNVPRAPVREAKKAPVPYLGVSHNTSQQALSTHRAANKLIGSLSMKDWDVDPLRVLKLLTGKEVKADEHSGLVS